MTLSQQALHGRHRRLGVALAGATVAVLAAIPVSSASAAPQQAPRTVAGGTLASPQDSATTHLFNPNSGLCLNIAGYSQAPSSHGEIWNCLNQNAESWQFRSDGTIYNPNSGLCLNTPGYGTSPSTHTEIWGCNGNPAEQWQLRGDGTIYNPNSGLCLNVAGYGTSPGSWTELWYCNGSYAEKWIPFTPPQ
jgi:hypothetical protein